tara:strand:- start:11 stop:457 length:447 start_codon:yes stop_codon:yes gene_type:complete
MPIKSFRGKLANSTEDTIHLHTNDGSTGYRMTKFQVIPTDPFTGNSEYVCKVYTISQSSYTSSIDFSDNTLLAAAAVNDTAGWGGNLPDDNVIFDNITFNQDIYISLKNASGTNGLNYHIELEQVKLDLNENTVATLKDIRNIEASSV